MIYIVTNNSPKYGGGVEQVVKNIVANFDDDFKAQVKILCSDSNEAAKFEFEGIECINFPTRPNSIIGKLFLRQQLSFSFRITRWLKRQANSSDVVNVHGLEYAFYPSLHKGQYQLIVTAHGCLFEQYSEYLAKHFPFPMKLFFKVWRWYIWLIEKTATRRADRFVFISNHAKEFVCKCYAVGKSTEVIPNGLNFSNNGRTTRREKTNNLLIVGSQPHLKGLDIAIQAVSHSNKSCENKVSLTIVGFGSLASRPSSTDPYIKYIGRVAPESMPDFYRQADALILPSRFEVFPMVVLESLEAGLPPLVSRACHLEEIDSDLSRDLTVKDYEIKNWVAAIKNLMDDAKYGSVCKKIRELELERFDWKLISAKYQKTLS